MVVRWGEWWAVKGVAGALIRMAGKANEVDRGRGAHWKLQLGHLDRTIRIANEKNRPGALPMQAWAGRRQSGATCMEGPRAGIGIREQQGNGRGQHKT